MLRGKVGGDEDNKDNETNQHEKSANTYEQVLVFAHRGLTAENRVRLNG
jgi:hypothetical protein